MTEFKVLLNGKSYIEYVWNEKQGKLTQSFKSAQATEDGFDLDFSKAISPITFPTSVFKEIFSANKDAKEMSLEISEKGLAKLEFDSDDYRTAYYVVSTEEAK